ncbi:hypothetical protein CR513_60835, partial [Mucuna pruriens]
MNTTIQDLKAQIGQLTNTVSHLQSARELPQITPQPEPRPTDTDFELDVDSQMPQQDKPVPLPFLT